MLAARQTVPAALTQAWSDAIGAHLLQRFPEAPGQCVGFCWPIRNEPDLRAALKTWQAVLALPVVVDVPPLLRFCRWTPEMPMTPDRYGIPTPVDGDPVTPDVLLIPLVAFDAAGYRLGYGGGFFDRTLATLHPRPLAIGIGFELNRVASLPTQPHDQPMDWIVTERGIWQTRSCSKKSR